MVKSKEMVGLSGLTGGFTMDNGKMVLNMDMERIKIKMVKLKMENGKMGER